MNEGAQSVINELQQELARLNAAREAEYKSRLALAVQCKALREALKESLEELEAISYERYRGIEAKCRAAMDLSAQSPDQVIAEFGK